MFRINAAVLRSGALLLVAAGAMAAFTAEWRSPLRTALALAFLLFVPGLAVTEVLDVRAPIQRLALAPATSLGLEAVVCLVLLYAGAFSVELALSVIAALSGALLLAAMARAARVAS